MHIHTANEPAIANRTVLLSSSFDRSAFSCRLQKAADLRYTAEN
jgi:hypothetical protein